MTLTLRPSYTSTITPASFIATASANPQSIAGTSIYGGTTTSSSSVASTTSSVPSQTSSAAPAATTTKKSSGNRMEGGDMMLGLAAAGLAAVGML